jgi:hypothetical protein
MFLLFLARLESVSFARSSSPASSRMNSRHFSRSRVTCSSRAIAIVTFMMRSIEGVSKK